MSTFNELGLTPKLLANLEKLNFTQPTPIQSEAIPLILAGHDVIGTAQTGMGKTAAFCLPILAKLEQEPDEAALMLAPTRELAAQIERVIAELSPGQYKSLQTTLLVGGAPMPKQIRRLAARPRLIIATPGRLNDLLRQRKCDLSRISYFVLDEADQMLDMGFAPQVEEVIQHVPGDRQSLFFTATLSKPVEKLAQSFLRNPVRVEVGRTSTPVEKIKQRVLFVEGKEKRATTLSEISKRSGSTLVFVRTKRAADDLARYLGEYGLKVAKLHGDCTQGQRNKALRGFRENQYSVLVATNVAARGLDIPLIETVFNYDLPEEREEYVHRIGRTARAGAEGESISLVAPEEHSHWAYIQGEKGGVKLTRGMRGRAGGPSGGRGNAGRRAPKRASSSAAHPRERRKRSDSSRDPGARFRFGGSDSAQENQGGRRKPAREERRSRFNEDTRPRYSEERRPKFSEDKRPKCITKDFSRPSDKRRSKPMEDAPRKSFKDRPERRREQFNDRPDFRSKGDGPRQKWSSDRPQRKPYPERKEREWSKDRPQRKSSPERREREWSNEASSRRSSPADARKGRREATGAPIFGVPRERNNGRGSRFSAKSASSGDQPRFGKFKKTARPKTGKLGDTFARLSGKPKNPERKERAPSPARVRRTARRKAEREERTQD